MHGASLQCLALIGTLITLLPAVLANAVSPTTCSIQLAGRIETLGSVATNDLQVLDTTQQQAPYSLEVTQATTQAATSNQNFYTYLKPASDIIDSSLTNNITVTLNGITSTYFQGLLLYIDKGTNKDVDSDRVGSFSNVPSGFTYMSNCPTSPVLTIGTNKHTIGYLRTNENKETETYLTTSFSVTLHPPTSGGVIAIKAMVEALPSVGKFYYLDPLLIYPSTMSCANVHTTCPGRRRLTYLTKPCSSDPCTMAECCEDGNTLKGGFVNIAKDCRLSTNTTINGRTTIEYETECLVWGADKTLQRRTYVSIDNKCRTGTFVRREKRGYQYSLEENSPDNIFANKFSENMTVLTGFAGTQPELFIFNSMEDGCPCGDQGVKSSIVADNVGGLPIAETGWSMNVERTIYPSQCPAGTCPGAADLLHTRYGLLRFASSEVLEFTYLGLYESQWSQPAIDKQFQRIIDPNHVCFARDDNAGFDYYANPVPNAIINDVNNENVCNLIGTKRQCIERVCTDYIKQCQCAWVNMKCVEYKENMQSSAMYSCAGVIDSTIATEFTRCTVGVNASTRVFIQWINVMFALTASCLFLW